MKKLLLFFACLLVSASAFADKNDSTRFWGSGVLTPDGGDVDYCLATTALADGAQTHTSSIDTNCDTEGELVTRTLGSVFAEPSLAPNHQISDIALGRGLLVQVDDADGSGLSTTVTITGWSLSGSTISETLTGLTDTTSSGGDYTAYFTKNFFTGVSAITSTTSGQATGDDITVGYGCAGLTPTYQYGVSWRFEIVGGTNAALISMNSKAAFTEGNAAEANYADQLVLEPAGSPLPSSRAISTHRMAASTFGIILDVLGAANAGEKVYFEATFYED